MGLCFSLPSPLSHGLPANPALSPFLLHLGWQGETGGSLHLLANWPRALWLLSAGLSYSASGSNYATHEALQLLFSPQRNSQIIWGGGAINSRL